MGSIRKIYIILLLISFILIVNTPLTKCVFGDSESELALIAIDSADRDFKAAYIAILEAEKSGGDISGLVSHFNKGLEYRYNAKKAYESGDYNKALLLANQALRSSEDISDYAILLEQVATYHEQNKLINQLLRTLVFGVFAVVLCFLSWRSFKVYYLRKMIASSPGVPVDES